FQYRNATGGQCGYSQVGGISAPVWVKLVRAGLDFSGYYSLDGSAWTPIGPSQTIPIRDLAPGGLAVTAHNNALSCSSTFTSVIASNAPAAPSLPPLTFGVYRQLWAGIGDGSLGSLTNNANFPNNPSVSYTKVFTNFETEVDMMENYSQRLRAFVVPPTNGNYVLWIASDDNSELWLSSDETPLNKIRVAFVPGWTASREWTKYPEQHSTPIALEGGRRYYVEALMSEGGGGDNLALRWQKPDGNFDE